MARRGGYIGWRWMALGAAAIVAVFIVALAAVRADLHELQVQEATLSLQMQLLEADYESLADELTRVGTDSYVENAARENYGFIRNGEIVFAFQNPEKLRGYTEEEYRIILEEMRD
jgi:cell division protein FtsB